MTPQTALVAPVTTYSASRLADAREPMAPEPTYSSRMASQGSARAGSRWRASTHSSEPLSSSEMMPAGRQGCRVQGFTVLRSGVLEFQSQLCSESLSSSETMPAGTRVLGSRVLKLTVLEI